MITALGQTWFASEANSRQRGHAGQEASPGSSEPGQRASQGKGANLPRKASLSRARKSWAGKPRRAAGQRPRRLRQSSGSGGGPIFGGGLPFADCQLTGAEAPGRGG